MKENPLHLFHEPLDLQSETFDTREMGADGEGIDGGILFTDSISEAELVSLRNKMFGAISVQKNLAEAKSRKKHLILSYLRVAAVFGLVAVYSYLFWTARQPDFISYETQAGEVAQFEFPDGTKITLNGNSKLSYANSHWTTFDRKVQMKGEAYFEVAKTSDPQRFHINEGDPFAVEVFGTTFNMKNMQDLIAVGLIEGSVKINLNKEGIGHEEAYFLEPGELAKFDGNSQKFTVEPHKNLDRISAWKEGKLKLKEDDLQEVLAIIGEIYGLEVVLASNELDLKKVTGTLPIGSDFHEMAANLSILFDKQIAYKEHTLTIY
ncbi:FecR family protein [Rhodonellum sp.]|uniref:FecR family protein n=1 Tax=Rhodonellum sp. TaxID=2231180 RepID=UPI00271F28F3|nr:FecR domain-containing protein [Rhodonellum sp.]MDO9551099.1 FecR domain-containing protein [Rhodonellum sp.]